MVKIPKKCLIVDRLDALNAKQKHKLFVKYHFCQIQNNRQKWPKIAKLRASLQWSGKGSVCYQQLNVEHHLLSLYQPIVPRGNPLEWVGRYFILIEKKTP